MALDERVSCCPDGLVTDRRRRIKVLDCTIRDGGICNQWQFSKDMVRSTFEALHASGVEYMEVGYRNNIKTFDPAQVGPWCFCDEKDLMDVVKPNQIKLSVMMDAHRTTPDMIPPRSESVIDVIRIATYAHDIEDKALPLLDRALEYGYETFINVMAVSVLQPEDVDTFLKRLSGTGVHNVALVDSFGALFPYHVRYLVRKYMNFLGEGIKLGVHFHNNQQQAFANTIAAIDEGVDLVDATIHGMGRGAGNCPLELLLLYLDNPRYDVRPILGMIENFANLRDDLRWGYHLPYAMTGHFNKHPRSGIDAMNTEERYKVLPMYEKLSRRLDEAAK